MGIRHKGTVVSFITGQLPAAANDGVILTGQLK